MSISFTKWTQQWDGRFGVRRGPQGASYSQHESRASGFLTINNSKCINPKFLYSFGDLSEIDLELILNRVAKVSRLVPDVTQAMYC